MEGYVDGFLLPLRATSLDAYIEISKKAGALWKEHGALDYRECVGDDLNAPNMVSFKKAAGATDDEVVIFAWITYPDKASRDSINSKVMSDPRLQSACEGVIDFTRMACGGFKTIVHI